MSETHVKRVALLNSARPWIGEAAHVLALAQGLAGRGVEVTLFVRRGHELEARARAAGVTTHALEFNSRFSPLRDGRDLRALRRVLRETRAQIVHTHRGKDHWLAAFGVMGLRPRPALMRTRHVVVPMRGHLTNRWLMRRATDRTLAVSEATKGSLEGVLTPPQMQAVPVVHSAVDLELFQPSRRDEEMRREQFGASPDEPVIGLVGRFQRVKGQGVLIDAAAKLHAEGLAFRLVLAGAERTPGRIDRMRQTASQRGLADRVRFFGEIDDIAAFIASVDIGVIASLGSEGSSRIAYEFMASGVPVVATRVGVLPEVIRSGESGLLCSPGDADELANQLRTLIEDPALRERLAEAGRAQVEAHHSLPTWLDRIQSLYGEAARARGLLGQVPFAARIARR